MAVGFSGLASLPGTPCEASQQPYSSRQRAGEASHPSTLQAPFEAKTFAGGMRTTVPPNRLGQRWKWHGLCAHFPPVGDNKTCECLTSWSPGLTSVPQQKSCPQRGAVAPCPATPVPGGSQEAPARGRAGPAGTRARSAVRLAKHSGPGGS